MKIFAIALVSTFVLGCGSAPTQEKESTPSGSSEEISLPPTGGDGNPCDRPQFSVFTENGNTYVVQVPTLCNQGPSFDPGDPGPDRGDPNPWDKSTHTYSQVETQEMGQRSAR